jgi:hypothetical protein
MPRGRRRKGSEAYLACGHVAEGGAPGAGRKEDGGQIIRHAVFQHGALDDRAGTDNPDDVPPHEALGQERILGLLADRHLVALGDQAGDVRLRAVIGHAAHGGLVLLRLAAIPRRQGEIQFAGGDVRVLLEHLIEVAQAEKQQAVRVLFLDFPILFFHGGQFSHRNPLNRFFH